MRHVPVLVTSLWEVAPNMQASSSPPPAGPSTLKRARTEDITSDLASHRPPVKRPRPDDDANPCHTTIDAEKSATTASSISSDKGKQRMLDPEPVVMDSNAQLVGELETELRWASPFIRELKARWHGCLCPTSSHLSCLSVSTCRL